MRGRRLPAAVKYLTSGRGAIGNWCDCRNAASACAHLRDVEHQRVIGHFQGGRPAQPGQDALAGRTVAGNHHVARRVDDCQMNAVFAVEGLAHLLDRGHGPPQRPGDGLALGQPPGAAGRGEITRQFHRQQASVANGLEVLAQAAMVAQARREQNVLLAGRQPQGRVRPNRQHLAGEDAVRGRESHAAHQLVESCNRDGLRLRRPPATEFQGDGDAFHQLGKRPQQLRAHPGIGARRRAAQEGKSPGQGPLAVGGSRANVHSQAAMRQGLARPGLEPVQLVGVACCQGQPGRPLVTRFVAFERPQHPCPVRAGVKNDFRRSPERGSLRTGARLTVSSLIRTVMVWPPRASTDASARRGTSSQGQGRPSGQPGRNRRLKARTAAAARSNPEAAWACPNRSLSPGDSSSSWNRKGVSARSRPLLVDQGMDRVAVPAGVFQALQNHNHGGVPWFSPGRRQDGGGGPRMDWLAAQVYGPDHSGVDLARAERASGDFQGRAGRTIPPRLP